MEKETNPPLVPVNAERRKHSRFPVHLRIEYRRGIGSRSYFGQLLDISESGVLLHLSEGMEVGQDLRLKIFIGSGIPKFIEARVRVVWRQFKKGAPYRIGARFIHISSEETFTSAYPKSTCASPARWISGMNTSCFTRRSSLTASFTWVYFPP